MAERVGWIQTVKALSLDEDDVAPCSSWAANSNPLNLQASKKQQPGFKHNGGLKNHSTQSPGWRQHVTKCN